ncbi:50S ribosomal protein L23 [Candidatus Gottesmanbacteria bacterium]|nr:50S ribosomal protein L23 [Candidatus Gottesmanbacteria bacterium]
MITNNILIKPIITERSLLDANQGVFTFMVERSANKNIIRQNIEDHFGVHVVTISTIHMKGKKRQVGRRRTKVNQADWKKAKVRLQKGEKIALFGEETKG